MKPIVFSSLLFISAWAAQGQLATTLLEYKHDGEVMEGFLVYDTDLEGKRPGVLIAHQWKGLGAYERKRAEMLAELGYTVLAADIYGKGTRAQTREEASRLAAQYKDDRGLLRGRMLAALDVLKEHRLVDPEQVAAIGYCFGGTAALELARAGADLAGVVSFHGGLATPHAADARNIKGRVLALHGGSDPFVPPAEVKAFAEEMTAADVDWQLIVYGHAVHSFTLWSAGNAPSTGAAYHEKADKRSWNAMKIFFADIFENSDALVP